MQTCYECGRQSELGGPMAHFTGFSCATKYRPLLREMTDLEEQDDRDLESWLGDRP